MANRLCHRDKGPGADLEAVAKVRQLVVCHGELAESCAVVQGFAKVSESIVL